MNLISMQNSLWWLGLHAIIWFVQAGIAGLGDGDYCNGVFLCNTPLQQMIDAWRSVNFSFNPRDLAATLGALSGLVISLIKMFTIDYQILADAPGLLQIFTFVIRFAGGIMAGATVVAAVRLIWSR